MLDYNHAKKEVTTMPLYHATWNLYCKHSAFDLHFTMRKKLPKTFSVLKFRMNLLNFSLKNISQNVRNFIFTKD